MASAGTALRFLGGGLIDASVQPDFSALALLPAPALAGLLDLACAYLSASDAAQLQTALEEQSQRHGLRPKAARGMARGLALALGGAVKFGLAPDALGADMKALGACLRRGACAARAALGPPHPTPPPPSLAGLDDAHAAQVAALYEARREALSQVAADAAIDSGALLDAEWRFGVAVATDDVGRVGATFVSAKLLVAAPGGGEPREQLVELSVPQFYDLLSGLEKAQAYTALLGKV